MTPGVPPAGAGSARRPLLPFALLPVGALLLIAAMAITITGVAVARLFRPGTWLILVALLLIAAGGVTRLAGRSNGD